MRRTMGLGSTNCNHLHVPILEASFELAIGLVVDLAYLLITRSDEPHRGTLDLGVIISNPFGGGHGDYDGSEVQRKEQMV